MVSKIDQRRLRDGARALALPKPKTIGEMIEEMERQLEVMRDGLAALQSLDDLGSSKANEKAWDDLLTLHKRYETIEAVIAELRAVEVIKATIATLPATKKK